MLKKTIALLTAAFITVGGFPAFSFAEGTDSIATAEELLRFLESCQTDDFSRGKTFTLVKDIDLGGEEISFGSVFCGVFDGGGHTVSNFKVEISSGKGGFFGEISEDGWVNNLNLVGDVSLIEEEKNATDTDAIISDIIKNTGASGVNPSEAAVYIGGLAGKNSGHIYNCSFGGSVSGRKYVGGIVGENEDSGVINAAANSADIYGIESVGGICGQNSGIIRSSVNNGIVNEEADASAVNVGGIAGSSEGVIEDCANRADVGCVGYGTNTGGIAGKQSGCIIGSNNTAAVAGKKNTGGIVGIFSPYTDIDANMDSLRDEIDSQKQDLEDEFDGLQSDIENDIEDLKDSLDIFSLGKENSSSLTEGRRNVLDSVASYIDKAAENSGDRTGSLKELLDSIDGALDDTEAVNDSLTSMLDGLDENLGKLTDSLTSARSSSDETAASVRNMLDTLSDGLESFPDNSTKLVDSISDAIDSIDLSSNAIDDIADSISSTMSVLNRTLRSIDNSSDDISDSITAPLDFLYKRLKAKANEIDARKKKLENFKEDLTALLEKIKEAIEISGNGWSIYPDPDEDDDGGFVEYFDTESGILGKILGFILPVAHAADTKSLSEIFDTDAIKEELKKVISVDVALDRNVAGEYFDNAVVQGCGNFGDVNASSAVGGIVGCMGVERLYTDGETVTLPNGKPVISDITMKAVVNSCVNDAKLYAKEESCGGIAGYANMGIIKNCLGAGEIEAAKSAGGIGGNCVATVLYSIGAARVSGDEELGGIAGRGGNIRECYSISVIENENAKGSGAIAAAVEGSAKNNYFIDEGIGGIGGTSYSGSAEGLTFEDMISSDVLPDSMSNFFNDDWYVGSGDLYFPQLRALAEAEGINSDTLRAESAEYAKTHFNVTFVIDGEVVKSLVKEYNSILDESEIPEIPKKNDSYPHWDRSTSEPIRRHTVFEAVYDEAVTTISSGETPPIILLEGLFSQDSKVEIEEIACSDEFDGYKIGKAYSFTVTPSADARDGFTARILDKKGKGVAIALIDEKTVIDCERDGSYLVCEMSGAGKFVILENDGFPSVLTVTVIVCAILLILGGILLSALVRKKRKTAKN